MFTLGNGFEKNNAWNMPEGYSQKLLKLLKHFDLRVVIAKDSWLIVTPVKHGHPKCYKWFQVTDNGGEVMVYEVNDWDHGEAVPYKSFGSTVCPATLADRIATVIKGEPVNWDSSFSPAEEETLLATR